MNAFISYAHKDAELCRQLERILNLQKKATFWRDVQIQAGEDWNDVIRSNLERSDIILLLISQWFFQSSFIPDNELEPVLKRHLEGSVVIVPVLLSACEWQKTRVSKFQALPSNGVPISDWGDKTEALLNVADGFGRMVDNRFARAAGACLTRLGEAAANPGVRKAIARYQKIFEGAGGQLRDVFDFKEVHDTLDDLQFQCLNPLRGLAREGNRPGALREAASYRAAYETGLATINRITKEREQINKSGGPDKRDNTDICCVRDFLASLKPSLDGWFESRTSEELQKFLTGLGALIAQRQPAIALDLNVAARQLNLDGLTGAISAIATIVSTLGIEEGVEELDRGVSALETLNQKLKHLEDEHTRWQSADRDFRLSEGALDRSLSEFAVGWPLLKTGVAAICAAHPSPAASLINERLGRLDQAVSTQNAAGVNELFGDLRYRASERFLKVDKNLKSLSGELLQMNAPLQHLLARFRDAEGPASLEY